jgi:hypothetical protein
MAALEYLSKKVPVERELQREIESLVPLTPRSTPQVEIILSAPNRNHERFQKNRYALIFADENLMKRGMRNMRNYQELWQMLKVQKWHCRDNVVFLIMGSCIRINTLATKMMMHVNPSPLMLFGFDKKTQVIESICNNSGAKVSVFYTFNWDSYKPAVTQPLK